MIVSWRSANGARRSCGKVKKKNKQQQNINPSGTTISGGLKSTSPKKLGEEKLIAVSNCFREMNPVDRRRELNRLAAQKLRNRQKEKAVTVKQVSAK